MAEAASAQSYPLTYDVEYPGELSRWLIFVKWILAIPHLVVLYGLTLVASALTLIAWFAIRCWPVSKRWLLTPTRTP